MDSNSNSFDAFLPKVEPVEPDRDCTFRSARLDWNSENTMRLIVTLERDCHELWNTKHPGYKDKAMKQLKYEFLADMFGTTVCEITRKIHNLRTQYNNERRKIKKRLEASGSGERNAPFSVWEYYDALSFFQSQSLSETMPDPLEMDAVNIELAEFQAEEEEAFNNVRAMREKPGPSVVSPGRNRKPLLRVAASAPPPLPPSAHPLMWPEQPTPRIRPGLNADECQIFGDFVASELRMLRSHESRKKLKRMIQKAILQVGEEEDVNINQP